MKKTLSSLRVEETTINNIKSAIRKYNEKNLVSLSENEFRRLSYELLAQIILQNKEIPATLQK